MANNIVDDALRPLRLNARERNRLFRALRCPWCENEIRALDGVRAYTAAEMRELRRLRRWDSQYRRALNEFDRFVTAFPSLGGLHDVGKLLERAVCRARVVTIAPSSLWFRATHEQEETDPQFMHRSAGRFHAPGQRALYVADDPAGATVELLRDDPTQDGTVWIKEFSVQRALRVIDLSVSILGTHTALPILLEGMRFSVRRRAEQGPASEEYHLTRYIADLVRRRNVDGLVHTSSRAHPFRDDVFSRNLLLTRAVPFSIERDEQHRWIRMKVPPFQMPEMQFDPPIPFSWWERLRRERREAAERGAADEEAVGRGAGAPGNSG